MDAGKILFFIILAVLVYAAGSAAISAIKNPGARGE